MFLNMTKLWELGTFSQLTEYSEDLQELQISCLITVEICTFEWRSAKTFRNCVMSVNLLTVSTYMFQHSIVIECLAVRMNVNPSMAHIEWLQLY